MKAALLRLLALVTIPVWVPLVIVLWAGTGMFCFFGWIIESAVRYVWCGDSKTKWFKDDVSWL